MHFWVCRMCERYARQIRFIRDIVHHYLRQLEDDAQFAPDLSLPAAARDRLRQRLREEPK
jgi:hypothetical protein